MTIRPGYRAADVGRAAIAEAEATAFGGTEFDAPVRREVLHERLAAVVAGPWWAASGPPVSIATPRRTARSSTARCAVGAPSEPVEIRLTDEQLTSTTVAHELAHALAGVARGHDALFRRAYVDVTAVLDGRASAERLAAAFDAFGLDVVASPPWPSPWIADGDTFRLVP